MGEENSFPVFFGRGVHREPYGWRRANSRALYLKRESTFKSLLDRGWLDGLGEKTLRIKYGEPGEVGDFTLSLKVYRLTALGVEVAKAEMERCRYDFDASVAAGTWVLAQNPS
jgi:hypothetical protein